MWKRILLILGLGAAGGATDAAADINVTNPMVNVLIATAVTMAAAAINTKKQEINKPKDPPTD